MLLKYLLRLLSFVVVCNLLNMKEKTKYISSSAERRIPTYLKPRTFMMFTAEQKILMRGKSEHSGNIIDKYYEALPESRQRYLIELYELAIKK